MREVEAHVLPLALIPLGCAFNHPRKQGTSSAIFPGNFFSTINWGIKPPLQVVNNDYFKEVEGAPGVDVVITLRTVDVTTRLPLIT